KGAARRVSAPDQHLQLARDQRRARARPGASWPRGGTTLRQTLRAEPEAGPVIEEDSQHVFSAVTKDEERSVHRLLLEDRPRDRGRALDPIAEVDRLVHDHHVGIRRDLYHWRPPAPSSDERSPS